jgi:hypothetical protein
MEKEGKKNLQPIVDRAPQMKLRKLEKENLQRVESMSKGVNKLGFFSIETARISKANFKCSLRNNLLMCLAQTVGVRLKAIERQLRANRIPVDTKMNQLLAISLILHFRCLKKFKY